MKASLTLIRSFGTNLLKQRNLTTEGCFMNFPSDIPQSVQIAVKSYLEHLLENETTQCWLNRNTQLFFHAVPDGDIPEYTDSLPEGYSVSLVITSDEGGGIFYVTKTQK